MRKDTITYDKHWISGKLLLNYEVEHFEWMLLFRSLLNITFLIPLTKSQGLTSENHQKRMSVTMARIQSELKKSYTENVCYMFVHWNNGNINMFA